MKISIACDHGAFEYKELIKKCNEGDIDFSDITTVNLDEYRGLPRTNDQSYYYFMNDYLFNHVNINKEKMDHYSIFSALCKKYGRPNSVSPDKA